MTYLEVYLLIIGTVFCYGLPDGAPSSVCSSMTPKHHGIKVQSSKSSYVVVGSKMENGHVLVRIFSEANEDLQGFALQARSAEDRNRPVEGYFTTIDGITQTRDCFREDDSMLTHVNPISRREVMTKWIPNSPVDQHVIFRATVAKSFSEFWTNVDSAPIKISGPYSNRTRIELNERNLKEQKLKAEEKEYEKVFDGCFKTKGCFGMPSGCESQRNCQVLLTYGTTEAGIAFELKSRLKTRSYMAAGFSMDSAMGDDYVVECIRLDGADVTARESWNSGKKNIVGDFDRSKLRAKYVDGILTCSWISSLSFHFNKVHFDLENSTYVLLAEGPMQVEKKGIHRHKIASPNPVNFTAFEMLGAAKVAKAIKVHGALMVTGWIGFVSLGIFISRYFKDGWPEKTLCGVKIWFALHRALMFLALTCVLIAVVVIFVHYNGWNPSNTHSVLGVITVVLGFLQPIMANFRPDPESPKRPIFNWLHLTVGTLAHLFSLITLYMASRLEASGLDKSFYWVLTIFVVVYLFFHVLLQVHLWKTKRIKTNEINMLNMSGGRNMESNGGQKIEGQTIFHVVFRVIILCIYSVVLVTIVVSLYALIGRV